MLAELSIIDLLRRACTNNQSILQYDGACTDMCNYNNLHEAQKEKLSHLHNRIKYSDHNAFTLRDSNPMLSGYNFRYGITGECMGLLVIGCERPTITLL